MARYLREAVRFNTMLHKTAEVSKLRKHLLVNTSLATGEFWNFLCEYFWQIWPYRNRFEIQPMHEPYYSYGSNILLVLVRWIWINFTNHYADLLHTIEKYPHDISQDIWRVKPGYHVISNSGRSTQYLITRKQLQGKVVTATNWSAFAPLKVVKFATSRSNDKVVTEDCG